MLVTLPAVVVAPMVAFSFATVGAPYPATAAAKVEGGLLGWLGGLREPLATTVIGRPWAFLKEWVSWLWLTHVLLAIVIGPAIVLQSFAISLVVSLLTLAISALSRSARVAGLGLFGLIIGTEMVRLVLQQGFRQKPAMLLSIQADLRAVGAALFGIADRDIVMHWGWAALVLLALSLGCLAILRSRVRAVEIVR